MWIAVLMVGIAVPIIIAAALLGASMTPAKPDQSNFHDLLRPD
jgi:hypothetical protein